jgi:hypothetical protein
VVDGRGRDGATDDGGLGFDALLGALGGALRSGSWPPGWTGAGWSNAWSAAAREVPPDLADHLLAATSQLLGAVRGFVEVAERVVDEQRARLRDDPVSAPPDAPGAPDASGSPGAPSERDETGSTSEAPAPPSRRVRRIVLDDDR